jgi:hypothetical protein
MNKSNLINVEQSDDILFRGEYIPKKTFDAFNCWLNENEKTSITDFKTRGQIDQEELEKRFPKDKIRDIFLQEDWQLQNGRTDFTDMIYNTAYALLRAFLPEQTPQLSEATNLTAQSLKQVAAHIGDHKLVFCQVETSNKDFLSLPAKIGPIPGPNGDFVISLFVPEGQSKELLWVKKEVKS